MFDCTGLILCQLYEDTWKGVTTGGILRVYHIFQIVNAGESREERLVLLAEVVKI
jgi:hypothetical protein